MNLKLQSASYALAYVRSGMVLGLGSGTTAGHFVDLLGERLRAGELRDIVGVPTSEATADRARCQGVPLTTLDEHRRLDLAVDGADEVDPSLNLIKGLGRCLLREKIVVAHADRFLVLVDEAKLVDRLGTRGPMPVEIVPFAALAQVAWLDSTSGRAELWEEADGSPAVTDNGNYLARCWFPGGIADPYALARTLADRPGIVDHGLFLDVATTVIAAGPAGVRVLNRTQVEAG
ncbi:MAG: ribose-5-phosphate isomerase RpiA [Anaerolineae bacterium]|nr:ribose-5-phosphate isomerase RpiA [Anaerolineae bacterium]